MSKEVVKHERVFNFSINSDQLTDLIYVLEQVDQRVTEGRQLELTIDLDKEIVYVKMLPVEMEEFAIGFDLYERQIAD